MAPCTLNPVPPFDFDHSAAIFSTGVAGIRIFHHRTFRYALMTSRGPVLVEVCSSGSPEQPGLLLTVSSDRKITGGQEKEAARIISRIFSIDDDMVPFYRAVAQDPVLTGIISRLRGLRAPVTPTVFEALTDSIIEQQISLAAARAIENRLIRLAGEQVTVDGVPWSCYPDPPALAGLSDSAFRSSGLTLRKGEYIRDISRQIVAGEFDPEQLRKIADTESVISELLDLRGIGRWTAELTTLRGLHRPDAFPADDVGVRRFIANYYRGGRKILPADARVFAERWGEWKGFAAYYLEVADHLGIEPLPGSSTTSL